MTLFDTHAHFQDARFAEDRDAALSEAFDSGVSYIVNVGTDLATSKEAIALAEQYTGCYAAIGVHPHDSAEATDADYAELAQLCAHQKVVAIGEIGLDYHYDFSDRTAQMQAFRRQMQWAQDVGMPVVIHDREAHGDVFSVIREFPKVTGILHSYSGSAEWARQLVELGWYISFSGVITFQNANKVLEAAKAVPLDRLLIETDCPYLAPVPMRGKRNSSLYVRYTAERLAQLRDISFAELAEITTENAKRVFHIS